MQLKKITTYNGFDKDNPDNAQQNNYAWSMVEFNGYMYVGTGRNVVYRGMMSTGFEPTQSFTPENLSLQSEIWRYPIKTHNSSKKWERVYQAPIENGPCLFRKMVLFENNKYEKVLVGGSYTKEGEGFILTSKDGLQWDSVPIPIVAPYYVRPMIVFKDKLYVSACQPLDVGLTTYLYVTENPQDGWTRVNTDTVTGEIFSMQTFNGYLYIGTMALGGFNVYKSQRPEKGDWQLVVDKGAGDELNEIPMDMEVFNNHLYIGSGINGAVYSTNPSNRYILPKGFDIIRVGKNDKWEVIVGKEPVLPTNPTTGIRRNGFHDSGFGNMFNAYCWTLKTYDKKLFVGSWDSAILYKIVIGDLIAEEKLGYMLKVFTEKFADGFNFSNVPNYNFGRWMSMLSWSFRYYPKSFGFDLLETSDGVKFKHFSYDGLYNEENYGVRNMVVGSDGKCYIGTANPTQGCEVWTLEKERQCHHK